MAYIPYMCSTQFPCLEMWYCCCDSGIIKIVLASSYDDDKLYYGIYIIYMKMDPKVNLWKTGNGPSIPHKHVQLINDLAGLSTTTVIWSHVYSVLSQGQKLLIKWTFVGIILNFVIQQLLRILIACISISFALFSMC
jgi:hypothetical protein